MPTTDRPLPSLPPLRSSSSPIHANEAPSAIPRAPRHRRRRARRCNRQPVSCDQVRRFQFVTAVRRTGPRLVLLSVSHRAATSASCLLWLKSFEHGRSNRQRRGGMAPGSSLVESSQSCSRGGCCRVSDCTGSRGGFGPFNDRHERLWLAVIVPDEHQSRPPRVPGLCFHTPLKSF